MTTVPPLNRIAISLPHSDYYSSMVEPFEFDRIYGAWWDRLIERDAKAAVARSDERYVRAIGEG